MSAHGQEIHQGEISFARGADATLVLQFSGEWRLRHGLPNTDSLERELKTNGQARRIAFETTDLGDWDSGLLSFLVRTIELSKAQGIEVDRAGLPSGVRRLLALAEAVPETKGARTDVAALPLLDLIGTAILDASRGAADFLGFLGDVTIALANLLRGRARYRKSDLLEIIQQCGANALGIVTLISYLVGVILAFMGAVQLEQFGAAIFVADLVAIGIVREMGAMMTGIIMSGRTGAAFAAQLGTMKVTQEIDALATMGISPMEFLVLPRVLALILMMPLLCLYSDLVGILGGATVGVTMLHLSFTSYVQETIHALSLFQLASGLMKATTYGVLIAVAGCMRGLQCGSGSSAVGDAATAAVVTSIVSIVVACGLFAVVFSILGI